MFAKLSRYRKLPEVVTIDVKGRALPSKSLRPLPDVTGAFLHTVEEIDRLDHLAYKYYKQPRKWWRICDANPEFMAPPTLLGKDTLITQRFPVIFSGVAETPPWADLLNHLAAVVGIEDVRLADDEASVMVTYNQMNIQLEDLVRAIEEVADFETGPAQHIGRVGKQIIIPPDITP